MNLSKNIISNSGVKFGTSGARGLVEQFSDQVCAAFTVAFIDAMRQNFGFKRLSIAMDNRPVALEWLQHVVLPLTTWDWKSTFLGCCQPQL